MSEDFCCKIIFYMFISHSQVLVTADAMTLEGRGHSLQPLHCQHLKNVGEGPPCIA